MLMTKKEQMETLKQFRATWGEVFDSALIERAIRRTRKRFEFHSEQALSYPPAAYMGELEFSLNEVIQ